MVSVHNILKIHVHGHSGLSGKYIMQQTYINDDRYNVSDTAYPEYVS